MNAEQLIRIEKNYVSNHMIANTHIDNNHPNYYLYERLFNSRHIKTQNKNLTNELKHKLSIWGLTKFEMLILLCYLGDLSVFFDNGNPNTSPYPINIMCKALDSILLKAPTCSEAPLLYRQHRGEDLLDLKRGDIWTNPSYLTTSINNWNQDCHHLVITPKKRASKAKSLYKLRNDKQEYQVTFMRGTSFQVDDVQSFIIEGNEYNNILITEL